jgi:outer membrane lipoprotein-sorting protein
MRFLRRISTRQLLALSSAVVVLVVAATVIALAATSGGPKPPPRPLAAAVHDALAARPVPGVSARIQFTNHLVDSSSIQGSDPILTGASGRLWASDGRLRLELQSDASLGGGTGDVQVLLDHRKLTVYDSGANTAYEGKLPAGNARAKAAKHSQKVPSVARIKRGLAKLADRAIVSGAIPSDVAGRPAYTVRVSPRHGGGLLGGAELAWDAAHGTPLRAAVYARGSNSPVLELTATNISFGPVDRSVFDITPPASAKVTNLSAPRGSGGNGQVRAPVTGAAAVAKRTPFKLAAPRKLAGQPRGEVRLISIDGQTGALVTYGRVLGGIAAIEEPAKGKAQALRLGGTGDQPGLKLPKVSINGATGTELDTALGTVIRFQRDGVAYTIVGSVPPAAAKAAARGL